MTAPHATRDSMELLADAASALAGALDLDALLETVVRVAADVTGARYAALGVIGPDDTLSRFATQGADEAMVRAIGHYPRGKGILGLLIREPRVLRLDDLSAHPESYGFPPGHPPMTSFLGAPVRSTGRAFGNLYLTDKPGGFDESDEAVILVLAAQAGAAVENALLSGRLQLLAVHDERDRISRELHDGVIQSLFSIGMGLESARSLIRREPARVEARIDSAIDALDGAMRELRNYIFQLRPHQAASMGLRRGLAELAREYEVNALVRPELHLPADLDARVAESVVPDLLQIVREALSNVAKHADASTVVLQARLAPGSLVLVVVDDGRGFVPGGAVVGRGLENIRGRAAALGADLEVVSSPGDGTTVSVRLSLPDSRHLPPTPGADRGAPA